MIDYVYRYDPSQAGLKPAPEDSEGARQALITGNRVFSEWMATCVGGNVPEGGSQHVVPCGVRDTAISGSGGSYPVQKPFAVVLGCSDARVPTELLFGQGFNDLFVVRVAGNVLGDEVQGTIDYSVLALNQSIRALVVLGHTNCGAVKATVDAYLEPEKFWSGGKSPNLQLILQRIFGAVRESDDALRRAWGADAASQPGYREALNDMAICLNAAHMAFSLREQVEAAGRREIGVLFGVYDVCTHQVCMPLHPGKPADPANVNLADAPAHPREFAELAARLADILRRPGAPTLA
jgi:carbonic anhydrase